MKQFIVLIAIQLFLCVCYVTSEEECPAEFERVQGISEQRCFYYYMTTAEGILTKVHFADALEICKGKNATVFELKSPEEGQIIYNFVLEKRNGSYIEGNWINYRDIVVQASLEGKTDTVFMTSHYMGSLSTLAKLPKDWWTPKYEEGHQRDGGEEHCALWGNSSSGVGVWDYSCSSGSSFPLVCEREASQNLKQYLQNLDDAVGGR